MKNVVHRDLKPENILYDHDSNTLLIADFGIAWFAEDELYTAVETKDNGRLANFQYAAPEQRDRGAQVDQRADIYSLACILNEMFTPEIPYGTAYKAIGAVAPDFEYLDEVVDQMLRRGPEERQTNIGEVKNQLIAHKNEFITRQRISALTTTVVPENELDDPLIVNPPRLVNFDWESERLTLILSSPVNEKWNQALHNMGSFSNLGGFPPTSFSFTGSNANIQVPARHVQDIIDHFNKWLPRANAVYKQRIENETRRAEEIERKKLQQELEMQQARQRILGPNPPIEGVSRQGG